MVYSVTVTQLIEKMDLKNHTPEIDTDKILIQDPGMNRPAVQFGGFFEHFDAGRIQIVVMLSMPMWQLCILRRRTSASWMSSSHTSRHALYSAEALSHIHLS